MREDNNLEQGEPIAFILCVSLILRQVCGEDVVGVRHLTCQQRALIEVMGPIVPG